MSVVRLSIDTTDPRQRRRVEQLYSATFRLRRAVQADARHRVDAYWAAPHERARSPEAVKERLGLTKKGLEQAAQAHLDAAPHLLRWCSKALGLHLADSVWTAVDRHLFADAAGKRFGRPKVGGWWDYTRIPGRARSHTTTKKWETFRLHGTLDATRQAMDRTAMRAAGWRYHRPVPTPGAADPDTAWWAYDGPLQVVLTGHGDDTIVLPVRLPTAPSAQAHLDWYLARPELWHKIDLVRHRDPHSPGGWAYSAHLLCLVKPYASPATELRRQQAATATAGRRAGGDVNVSNLTIASHHDGGDLKVTTIVRTADEKAREQRRRVTERRRQKALERSRRNTNPDQYHPSDRQEKAAKRRADQGLPSKAHVPRGPRKTRADGRPERPYRNDTLSNGYRRGRGAAANQARAATIARRQTAARLAGEVVAVHGTDLTIEAGSIATWARTWGKAVHAFTSGLLIAAIETEVAAIAPGTEVKRAGTRSTAMSQHCLCGHRHKKTLADPADPTTARVDYDLTGRLLDDEQTRRTLGQTTTISSKGVQARLGTSTDTPDPITPVMGEGTRPPAPAGSASRTGQVPTTTPEQPTPGGDVAGTRPTTNPDAPPPGTPCRMDHGTSLRPAAC